MGQAVLARTDSNVIGLRCILCGAIYDPADVPYTCPACGRVGILDVLYDYDRISHQLNRASLASNTDRTIWRYLPLLPITAGARLPSLHMGMTPIYDAPALAKWAGVTRLLLKDDGRLPSGSFKDRASAIGAVRALAEGCSEIAVASTGNAASSLAGMAANMGLHSYIFVPRRAPQAKLTQLLIYGATVFSVEGPYENAYDLATAAVDAFGWYNRSCAVNPYLVEGKKTCGLEIAEQLGMADDDANYIPDVIAVSVGDGCTIAGIWKGMREMHLLGLIPRLPRLLGVQASGANPISRAWRAGTSVAALSGAESQADSIAVGVPRNGHKALAAIRESGGAMVDVSDQQILAAIPLLGRTMGVFAEPAAAAALAGVQQAVSEGLIGHERVLAVLTGNGLKDVASAMLVAPAAHQVTPNLDEVRQILHL